jgi:hypothetical protein
MDEEARALNVSQKLVSKPYALSGSFDETRDIRQHKTEALTTFNVANCYNAEIR